MLGSISHLDDMLTVADQSGNAVCLLTEYVPQLLVLIRNMAGCFRCLINMDRRYAM